MIPLRDNVPTEGFAVATLVLIAINVFVFLFFQGPVFTLAGEEQVNITRVAEYGVVPYRFSHPGKRCELLYPDDLKKTELACQGTKRYDDANRKKVPAEQLDEPAPWATLFSSMFMHGGWLHLFFNMLFLWIFGKAIEDSMGPARYVVFYLLGGLAADALQILSSASAQIPSVGASGAIAAVLGGYALLYPRARVLSLVLLIPFIFLTEIPSLILLGIWFVLQFLPAIGQLAVEHGGDGGIAYFAHVGGFLFGVVAIKLFAKQRREVLDLPPEPPQPAV